MMRNIILLLLLFFFTSVSPIYAIPAFPGAEGFGSQTPGGRGGKIYKVTNLNDKGAGSLRDCLEAVGINATQESDYKRICVFTVGGTINLSSVILIKKPYLTVAGQTAPGDGILIRGVDDPDAINSGEGTIEILTHDVIVRGLRIRSYNRDAIGLFSFPNPGTLYNVIIDHNSFSWSVDTIVNLWYDPSNVTISWNIISEPSISPALASHNYGVLIGGHDELSPKKDPCEQPGRNISLHHNLISQASARAPLIKHKIGSPEVINNVIYNHQYSGTATVSEAAIIGNTYIMGKNSEKEQPIKVLYGGECPSLQPASVYVSHNIGYGRLTDTGDDWNIVNGDSQYRTNTPPFALSGVTVDNVVDVQSKVLAKAGATIPKRDAVDVRVINDVNNKTGGYINHPNDVGGWPTLSSGIAPLDIDNDGLPDSWDASNRNSSDLAPSGYTWIEEYMNSFFSGGSPPPSPTVPANKTGDTNADNKVDGIDYVAWLNHYDQSVTGTTNGDFNNSGKVDGGDYAVWMNNYGK